MVKLPAGRTTISGQVLQSRNTAPATRDAAFACASACVELCGSAEFPVRSYTSRIAFIRVSGSSNWIYSELLRVKICFEFDDNASQRAWARVVSFSYLRCSGVSGGFLSKWPTPWLPEVSTRMGREPNDRLCCCR